MFGSLPLPQIKPVSPQAQADGMARTIPSREFMVRQACLNAAAEVFPLSAKRGQLGARLAEQGYANNPAFLEDSLLGRQIRIEFRALARRFQVAA